MPCITKICLALLAMPSISVIIPTYNREQYLPRAIDSVLSQTYTGLELIIVDDASTDGTEELVKSYNDQRVKYIKLNKNSGVSTARNTGIKKALYDWVAFLDSDDEWFPHKLKTQINFLKNNKNIKLIHSNEIWHKDDSVVKQLKKHQKFGGHIFDKCLPLCSISPSTVLIHKDIFNGVGLFNEDFVVCEDYDLWLRITYKHDVGLIKEPLINKYGGHSDQLSYQLKAMDYWRVKALAPFFDPTYFEPLPANTKELLRNIMLQKCQLLMKGYKKRGNIEKYNEVGTLLKLAK